MLAGDHVREGVDSLREISRLPHLGIDSLCFFDADDRFDIQYRSYHAFEVADAPAVHQVAQLFKREQRVGGIADSDTMTATGSVVVINIDLNEAPDARYSSLSHCAALCGNPRSWVRAANGDLLRQR